DGSPQSAGDGGLGVLRRRYPGDRLVAVLRWARGGVACARPFDLASLPQGRGIGPEPATRTARPTDRTALSRRFPSRSFSLDLRAWATESVIWVDLRRRSETRRQSCIDTNAGFRRNPQNRICKEIAIQRPKIGKLDYLGLPNDSAQALAFEFFTDH